MRLKQVFWSKAEIDYEMDLISGKGGHFFTSKSVTKIKCKVVNKMTIWNLTYSQPHESGMWYFSSA